MIITRISGGLGNQMFQYAIAKSIAKRKNDTFKLDNSFYSKQTLRKYELNLFYIEENISTENENILLRGKEDLMYRIRKKLNFPINRPSTYINEKKNSFFDKSIFSIKNDMYIDGFWQNENYFIDLKDSLIKDFTAKKELSLEGKNQLLKIRNTESVSVHVRRGDYVQDNHTNTIHGICDLNYYINSTIIINEKINNAIFYIFSDDIKWCKENFSFLKNKVYIDDTKSAVEDLELMKNCNHNIIANSTFSWWGAWLNTNKNKIVISPKIWWNANPKDHISPKSWIRI